MNMRAAILKAVVLLAGTASAQMDDSRLLIGAYCLQVNARTDAHVEAIRECGVDFIVGIPASDTNTLDIFARHGVGAVVNKVVARWTDEITFREHPAIWAVDIGDEPPATEFERYGRLIDGLKEKMPGVPLYMNLNPNYGRVAENTELQVMEQLGTESYEKYIAAYCEEVPLDYLSYDFYPYWEGERQQWLLSRMYDNFIVVAEACRKTGRAFWYIPQLNSRPGCVPLSANMLRFQANVALSFGATVITWGCWSNGWWENNVLDKDGRQTEQYAKLREANLGLKRIGQEYMRFKNVRTHFVGFGNGTRFAPGIPVDKVDAFDAGPFSGLRASNGAPILVGEMEPRRQGTWGKALFVTAVDDPLDEHHEEFSLLFKANGVKAFGANGPVEVLRAQDGFCAVPIESCGGVLLVAED